MAKAEKTQGVETAKLIKMLREDLKSAVQKAMSLNISEMMSGLKTDVKDWSTPPEDECFSLMLLKVAMCMSYWIIACINTVPPGF